MAETVSNFSTWPARDIVIIILLAFNAGGLIYAFKYHLASLKRGQKYLKDELEKQGKELVSLKDLIIEECRGCAEELSKVKAEVAHIRGRLNKE